MLHVPALASAADAASSLTLQGTLLPGPDRAPGDSLGRLEELTADAPGAARRGSSARASPPLTLTILDAGCYKQMKAPGWHRALRW